MWLVRGVEMKGVFLEIEFCIHLYLCCMWCTLGWICRRDGGGSTHLAK